MINQKEATYNAVVHVTGHKEGVCSPTPEQRKQINMILFAGFRAGEIQLEREFTDKELMAYVSGLQSNWLRKDKRLNGGVTYVAKNPGSRQGVGDSQLKNLMLLKSTVTDPTEIAEIEEYIAARKAEIAAAKAPTINYDVLPESLRNKFKK